MHDDGSDGGALVAAVGPSQPRLYDSQFMYNCTRILVFLRGGFSFAMWGGGGFSTTMDAYGEDACGDQKTAVYACSYCVTDTVSMIRAVPAR